MPCAFKTQDGRRGCQFAAAEEPLYSYGNKTWCEFHLPVGTKKYYPSEYDPSEKATWDEKRIAAFNHAIVDRIKAAGAAIYEDAEANLIGVVFPGDIDLSGQTLPAIDFREATFSGHALFNEATFSGHAWFREATFSGVAWFEKATFNGDAWFEKATFNGDARFEKATFTGAAEFEKATFTDGAYFQADTGQDCDSEKPRGDHFHFVTFEKAEFKKAASFLNRRFMETTSFSQCTFKQAPNFHNCLLHQDTDFKGTDFPDTTSEHADRAYRTLKLAMEQTRARDEQARFYALEQQCIQNRKDTPKWVKISSYLYELTSNYGQSVLRPLVGLVSTFLISWLFYLILVGFDTALYTATIDFAFEQIIRPFAVWSPRGKVAVITLMKEHYQVVRYIAAVQSLLSLVFVTLFVLALRWRYRRG